MIINQNTEHDWKYDGLDSYKGEYWFKCAKCKASDWIARYGRIDQLMPKECKGFSMLNEDDFDPDGPFGHDEKFCIQAEVDAEEIDRKLGLETVSFRLSSNDMKNLKQLASEHGIIVTALIREILSAYIKEQLS